VEGHWKLSYIADAAASKEFMSSRKPVISFSGNQISGNTNCNNFAGTLNLEGKKINFRDSNLAVTMIACEGKGEGAFMTALNRVDHYKLSDNGQTLQFLNGQTVELGFEKQ
jgi:heat shock protein HslJ